MLKLYAPCIALLLVMACHYDPRGVGTDAAGDTDSDLPTDDADVPAVGPTAIITSAKTDTHVLGVPQDGNVNLSALDSVVAAGRTITTYAWSSEAGCLTVAGPSTLAADAFQINATAITDGCQINLTVTDDQGLTSSTFAVVRKRLVGGYIAATDCLATYDPAVTTDQGTATQPFCNLDAALDAAADNAIADIFIEQGNYEIFRTYALPSLNYVGGYKRAAALWTPQPTVKSNVTSKNTDNNATLLQATGHGILSLSNFVLRRSARCIADCTMVEVRGTQVQLVNFELRRIQESNTAWDNPSPGTSSAIAITGETGFATSLVGNNLLILTNGADVAAGIVATGDVTLNLADSGLFPGTGGSRSFGIRLLNGANVIANNTNVDIQGNPSSLSVVAYAIAGGSTALLPGLDEGCTGATCSPAGVINWTGGILRVVNASFGSGLTSAGAAQVRLNGTNVAATAGSAEAVHTLEAASVDVTNATVLATYLPGTTTTNGHYAAGYRDGALDLVSGAYSHGSTGVSVSLSSITGTAVDQDLNVDRLAGVELMGTIGGLLQTSTFSALGGATANVTPTTAVAAATFSTTGVTFSTGSGNMSFRVANLEGAVTSVYAFSDGALTEPHNGSTNLSLEGCTYDAALAGADDALRACLVLAGSNGAVIADGAVTCKAEIPASMGGKTIYNVGIWTFATQAVEIGSDVTVTFTDFITSPASPGTAVVIGLLDGRLPNGTSTLQGPSSGLLINRLQVEIDSVKPASNVGVWLRDKSASQSATRTRLFNTRLILGSVGGHDTGIIVDGAEANITLNTVRYGTVCPSPPCGGTGAGLVLIGTGSGLVDVIGNMFVTGNRTSSSTLAPGVLDIGTTLGMQQFSYNLTASDSSGYPQALNFYRTRATTSSGVPLPQTTDTSKTEGDLEGDYGTRVSNNSVAANVAKFCAGTKNELGTQSAGTNLLPIPVGSEYAQELVRDDDGNTRSTVSYDVGANERVCAGL